MDLSRDGAIVFRVPWVCQAEVASNGTSLAKGGGGSKIAPGTTKDMAGLLRLSLGLTQAHTARCSHKNTLLPSECSFYSFFGVKLYI